MASISDRPEGAVQPGASGERRSLSPEVSHFLVQLSIALHKTATYPAAHPALNDAIQGLALRLNAVLVDRPAVGFGVGRDRLAIEGGATDPTNPVLRGLAESLHRHQIGALRFDRGISPAEVATFLNALARDTRRTKPLGAEENRNDERWPHIVIDPITLDELELSGETKRETRAEQLWLSLASATLQRGPEELLGDNLGTRELARAIRRNVQDASYDRVIAEYMLQVGQELVDKGGTSSQVAEQFGELISLLGGDTLQMLLELGADLSSRSQLVRDLHRVLPAQSVVTLTQAAADASKKGISDALLRLFSKLANNADANAGSLSAAADEALRDAISQLVEGWTLADPNPTRYRELLRYLSATGRTGEARSDPDAYADALRIVEVSLEAGAVGPSVWRAVDELVDYGRLAELVELIDSIPDAESAVRIRQFIVEPERVKKILGMQQQSRSAVDRVLVWAGPEAAAALLDALEAADSRATRRQIMGRLTSIETDIGSLIVERLERGTWYVQRNMLYLLGEMRIPPEFAPGPWLGHQDARVRREAIKVSLRVPGWREEAILAGLKDGDSRMLNLVLSAAAERCPPGIAKPLIHMLETTNLDTGIRTLAIRVLAASRAPEARDWLTEMVLGRRRWWRRPALAPKSPDVLAALEGLAQHWPSHPNASRALRLAARSSDAEIRGLGRTVEARL